MLEVKKSGKPIIQVCFTLKNGVTMDSIKEKLKEAKRKLDIIYPNGYLVKSCHLNRDICKEQGFSTEVHDVFDEIFGNGGYECELTEKTLADAKIKMNYHRQKLSMEADKLIVLSETELTNVALEIELFTENRMMII